MATPIVMPKLGMVMTEGIVAKWRRESGSEINQGEVIADIETEKISYELEATESGVLHTIANEGDLVAVSKVMGYLLAEGEGPPPVTESQPTVTASAKPTSARNPRVARMERQTGMVVPSTPGARKLAAKLGVEISQVEGTGPRGRVVEADIRSFKDKEVASDVSPAASAKTASSGPPPGLPEVSKSIHMSGMRKGIADHMRNSIQTTAQLTFTLEVDITEMVRKRKKASRSGRVALTNPYVLIKACAIALEKVPQLNTVLADGNIMHFDQINMGVAVALPEGLIVPVIRDVGSKSVFDIAEEVHALSKRAKDGRLSPDEVTGGTFTISVIPTVDTFTPILNRGQSAILGVGGAKNKPAVVGGQVVARESITINLTVDHQTVDGVVAASFMKVLRDVIEESETLFE